MSFQITQTQSNLVKELHLSGYSSPRFRGFQICMSRRSEEDFSFKSFKKQQTCWGLNFAYYCFSFSNVHNLLLLIDVHILFRLRSSVSSMFLVRAFRAHQKEPVPIRLVNVDMTPEQRFAELCLDGTMYYCLHYNKKILISLS